MEKIQIKIQIKIEIELIQSYLTEEEAKVIIPQYTQNFISEFKNNTDMSLSTPHDFLNYAFEWGKTPQGHDYWNHIHTKLSERYWENRESHLKSL